VPQSLFPGPGPDDAEPDGFPPGEDAPGPDQGLFVTLPAEELTLSGFAQNGQADTMAPGALLATIVDTVTGEDGSGLAGCSDDQLLGIISAARRQECRTAWILLTAIKEFARRAGTGVEGEFAADELASELHMSQASAAGQMEYSTTVASRLPKTFAAMRAGLIHPIQLRIIEEQTRILSDADAARADQILAAAAPGMTYGELRYAARKLLLTLDPEAIRKQKEAAKRDTHVRRFREESGNAGMVARELPSNELLASWQHVEQRTLDLRAAGLDGTLEELRVRAFLDLLQGRDSRPQPAPDPAITDPAVPDPANAGPEQPSPDSDPPGPPGSGGRGPGGPDPAPRRGPDAGPSLAALVTLTIPMATYLGQSEAPGDADGYGVLDGDDARDLAAAAARHPRTRWCITALNPDGTAAGHTCLRGRHPPSGTGPPRTGPPGTGPPITITTPLTPITRGPCDHAHGEVGYHPSRKLAHLIRARNTKCTAPGCGRPAARCDLDHTVPWDQGGITCECDLAPLCRRHHRCKQSQGWTLTQPEPGILIWRTPSGRTYATRPTEYIT
jgi:hypothetical protein